MAFCEHCGAKNSPTAKFCSECGAPIKQPDTSSDAPSNSSLPRYADPSRGYYYVGSNQQYKSHGCLKIILALILIYIAIGIVSSFLNPSISSHNKNYQSSNSTNSALASSVLKNPNSVSTYKKHNMPVGTVIQSGDFYIGLAYVKTEKAVTTALNSTSSVADGDEVIFAFFDVYNAGAKPASFFSGNVSAYADSIRLNHVHDYTLFIEDGIRERNSYELDSGTHVYIPFDFEVTKGWENLVVYYGDYSWSIDASEVTSESYNRVSLYSIPSEQKDTEIGYTSSTPEYEITYDGFEVISQKNSWGGPWVTFKFTMTNTTNETFDARFIGYKMRAYRNKYLLGEASNNLNDNLNGYINIFNLDDIKPGMSAQIYVAFDTSDITGKFMMTFDDSFVGENVVDYFYASNNPMN